MVDGGAELVKSVGPDAPVGIDPVSELSESIKDAAISDRPPNSLGIVEESELQSISKRSFIFDSIPSSIWARIYGWVSTQNAGGSSATRL